ncbi:cyclase family protein [Micromonospora sp. ATA32]|nr:cyclase family protein [Micromonospora sp. ATA32]
MADTARAWPSYDELLAQTEGPPGSAWRTFGDGDQLGTVNFMTPDRVVAGAGLVRRGRVFNLDYPVNAFEPFPSGTRHPATLHRFANNPQHRDDYLDSFYLQSSSQIDALRHIGDPRFGFYGGASGEEIDAGPRDLGIQHWAQHGIVGRGVLLDVQRDSVSRGSPLDPREGRAITVDDLEATAEAQGTSLEGVDILLVRTGWAGYYLSLDTDARRRANQTLASPGLAQSEEVVRWLWDHRVALVAADNVGVEAIPVIASDFVQDGQDVPVKGVDHNGMLHRPLISLLGMALGELWALDELAEDCAADGVHEFLLVASPLNLVGGAGSPANALAIK